MPSGYQVVDLFAGPGGLAEGFSAFQTADGERPFNVTLSIEKERSAHQTLQLRAFLRQWDEFPPEYYDALNAGRALPDWSTMYEGEWQTATEEALCLELGTAEAATIIDRRLAEISALPRVSSIVIGGPPCQAYSLVGRARNQSKSGYVPELDHRHYLYQEYIRILRKLRPVAFVMENVKGMLSSSLDGRRIFEKVLEDLRSAGGDPRSYDLFALAIDHEGKTVLRRTSRHGDFIVRGELFGVPQARHRVIIVGLRRDVAGRIPTPGAAAGGLTGQQATVRDVLSQFPKLRSGLSRGDDPVAWREAVLEQMDDVLAAIKAEGRWPPELAEAVTTTRRTFAGQDAEYPRASSHPTTTSPACPAPMSSWLEDPQLTVTLNHASRSHMLDDLGRYFFSAVFAQTFGYSPKAGQFPNALAPDHANWSSGKFADRFRTQCWDQPSTTVTSHISKDGHYFIHPDPQQCRALTVREAARLQTFPDNYLFLGNRTEQYVQVGNAVPPFLARQIAEVLHRALSAAEVTKGGF